MCVCCVCQQEDDVLDMLAECEAVDDLCGCNYMYMCVCCVCQQEDDVLDMLAECEAVDDLCGCNYMYMCVCCVCQQEDDVLDMLAECEAEERDGRMFIGPRGRGVRGPRVSPASCINVSLAQLIG